MPIPEKSNPVLGTASSNEGQKDLSQQGEQSQQNKIEELKSKFKLFLDLEKAEKRLEAYQSLEKFEKELESELKDSEEITKGEISNFLIEMIVTQAKDVSNGRNGKFVWEDGFLQFDADNKFLDDNVVRNSAITHLGKIVNTELMNTIKSKVSEINTELASKTPKKAVEEAETSTQPEQTEDATENFSETYKESKANLEEVIKKMTSEGITLRELKNLKIKTRNLSNVTQLDGEERKAIKALVLQIDELYETRKESLTKKTETRTSTIPDNIPLASNIIEKAAVVGGVNAKAVPEVTVTSEVNKKVEAQPKVEEVDIKAQEDKMKVYQDKLEASEKEFKQTLETVNKLIANREYNKIKVALPKLEKAFNDANGKDLVAMIETLKKEGHELQPRQERVLELRDNLIALKAIDASLAKSYKAAEDFYDDNSSKYPKSVIKAIQKELGITADGDFGPNTFTAIVLFQRKEGFVNKDGSPADDGMAGSQTLSRMPEAKKAFDANTAKIEAKEDADFLESQDDHTYGSFTEESKVEDDYDTEAMEDYNLGTITDPKEYKEGEYSPAERKIKILETNTLNFSQVENGKDFINYILDNADSFGDVIRALVTGEREVAQFVGMNGEKIGITFEKLNDDKVQISLDTPYFDGISDSTFDTELNLTFVDNADTDVIKLVLEEEIIELAKKYNTELVKLNKEEGKEGVETKEEVELISIDEAYDYVSKYNFDERDQSTYEASKAIEVFENPEGDEIEVKLYKNQNGTIGIYIDTVFGDGVSDMYVPVDNKDQIKGLISKSTVDYLAQYDLANNEEPAPVVELNMSGEETEAVAEEVAKNPTEMFKELSEAKFREGGSKIKYSDAIKSFENKEGDEVELKLYKKADGEMGIALDTPFGDNVSDAEFKVEDERGIQIVMKEAEDYYNMVYNVQNR